MNVNFERALAEINRCNKCGFCLPACPTYRLTGNEVDSPRGRIALVEGVAKGEIKADAGLEASLTYCLGCRACETACPSGVQYHRVLEAGKKALDGVRPQHRGMTLLPRTLLRLTTRPQKMARIARIAERLKTLPLPRRLKDLTPMLGYRKELVEPQRDPDPATADSVGFFRGCVQEALFPDANQAAQALLQAAGYHVASPVLQTCCGALAWHGGRADEARRLARANIVAFEQSGAMPIVNTAGGCGAMLSEYGEILRDDPLYGERAQRFSERVRDWTQMLCNAKTPLYFTGSGERVSLQNSCHLINVAKGGDGPGRLVRQVRGDHFVGLPSQDRCCGSAGIYNIQHPDWALRLLDDKMVEVQQAEPDRLLVVNPGCQLQMTLGVNRVGHGAVVEHLARYLYRAFRRAQREAQASDNVP